MRFLSEPEDCTWMSQYANGGPWLWIGDGLVCPYLVKGKISIRCNFSRCGFVGNQCGVIAYYQANSNSWVPVFESVYWKSMGVEIDGKR